jgi:putative lipoprotein
VSLLASIALVCAGCNSSSSSQTPERPAASVQQAQPSAITGAVSLRAQPGMPAVSSSARLELTLMDISQQPAVPVATKTIDPVGPLPVKYELPFKADDIIPDDIYEMRAMIVDGARHYTMPLSYPVLTRNRSTVANIELAPEPTPSEKMMADFKALQASIGGMKINQGSSLGDTQSSAWQTFRQDGELEFVREIVDFEKGGRTETDYAYKDSKPFVVVRKHLAAAGARPDSTDRAGWDAGGHVVMNETIAGGKTSELPGKAVSALYSDAKDMFKRAGGNKY